MADGVLLSTMPHSRTERLPRSPTSLSSNSSRRVSLRSSIQSEKQQSPSSPPARLNRKHVASLEIVEANSPAISELSISSPRSDPANSASHVCLCQPDPKIPRPRNAFILYRQHHQGQVIANNPGLANPDISKVIGAQWREQPVQVQNEWKRLAEEEKLRHQRQYPDYRYQPRRANKANAARTADLHDDPYRCSKCNGRFISQPTTPLTPFPPTSKAGPGAQRNGRKLPALPGLHDEKMETERQHLKRRSPEISPSSRMSTSQPPLHHRPAHLADTSRRAERDTLLSPRAKRPRPDNLQSPYTSQSPSWANAPPLATMRHPGYSDHQAYVRHPQTGRMEPPSALNPHGIHFSQQNTAHQMRLEDLRLPPLQTQVGAVASGSTPMTAIQRNASFSAARSIEAMVMSIPFLNKIKVISKIAPPFQPSGPNSPAIECRGPVIAVEGTDPKLIAEVGSYLEKCLFREGGVAVRTWSDVEMHKASAKIFDGDVAMACVTSRPNTPPEGPKEDKQPFILEYLDSVRAWHPRSAEITKFITTIPQTSKPATPRHCLMHPDDRRSDSPSKQDSPQCSPTSTLQSLPSTEEKKSALLPVALLPNGFSLTIADRAASRIPIDDAYAPVDHWQWMATLWRGIIGVDLTIYVNSGPRDDDGRGVAPTLGGAGVDVRTDARAIVLQCQNGQVEEKMLRRAGFEVGEWLRSLGTAGPKP